MSEKRFTIYKEDKFKDEWYAYPFYIKDNGEKVTGTMPMGNAKEVANLLNSLAEEMEGWKTLAEQCSNECNVLQKENEYLVKLISDVEKSVGVRIDNLIDEEMIDDE